MGIRSLTGAAAALTVVITAITGPVPAAATGPATRGYVLDSFHGRLLGFDPAANTMTERIPLGFRSHNFEIRPDGREIYATEFEGDTVAVVSTTSGSVIAGITVEPDPRGVSFSPDSRRAYVTHPDPGLVTVIDTGTRRVITTIPVRDHPWQSTSSPDGTRLYVVMLGREASGSFVAVIDTATNTVRKFIPVGLGGPGILKFSPDARFVLVANGAVIDTRTEQVVRTLTLGSPSDFEFSPDGSRIYAARLCSPPAPTFPGWVRTINFTTGATATIHSGGGPNSLEFTPDGRRIYVQLSGDRDVIVLDAATHAVVDRFGLVNDPPGNATPLTMRLSGTTPASQPGVRIPPANAGRRCIL